MAFSRTAALGYLRRAHDQNRLAHAYLIHGLPGSGKQMLAAELASLVNGTNVNEVFSARAREIFIARPESKSRRIVIEQIRDLEHALQMRASNGRRKVVIISDADRLQPQAAKMGQGKGVPSQYSTRQALLVAKADCPRKRMPLADGRDASIPTKSRATCAAPTR